VIVDETDSEGMDTRTAYDIIGDIHGCSQTLTALLDMLGYRHRDGNLYFRKIDTRMESI